MNNTDSKYLDMAIEAMGTQCLYESGHMRTPCDPPSKACSVCAKAFPIAADHPKRKFMVDDIQKPQLQRTTNGDYWYIRCGEYDWTSSGWVRQPEGKSGFPLRVANIIYAGLVATGNVPTEEANG